MLYGIGKGLSTLLGKIMGRMKVLGTENFPKEGGVLLCANHTSYIDPPILGAAAPRQVHYMAKLELFQIPVMGYLIRKAGAFPVKRGTADRTALKTAMDYLAKGEAVAIFPEGTRSMDGKLLAPESGVGMIALRSKVPIVPAALIQTNKLLPPHSYFFRFSRVKVVFGKPVDITDLYDKGGREAVEEVGRRIMAAIQELIDAHS